jgi:hypothetical protein
MCVVLQADSWCLGAGEDTGRRLSRWLGEFRRCIHVVVAIYTFVGLSVCINSGLEGRTHGRKWVRVVQVSKTMKI